MLFDIVMVRLWGRLRAVGAERYNRPMKQPYPRRWPVRLAVAALPLRAFTGLRLSRPAGPAISGVPED